MPSSLITVLRPDPDSTNTAAAPVDEAAQHGLMQVLATVPDPRDPRGIRYQLASLLAVAVCAVMAGAVTFAAIADWAADLDTAARYRLGFTGPIPANTTVWRFLIRLDPSVLQAVLSGWLQARITPPPAGTPQRRARTIIAVDGKVVRGARLPEGRQVHLLSAYDTTTGIVLAQSTTSTKSNEIPAFIPLLDQVQTMLGSLQGVVIVADALHAQVGHVHHLATQGAHLLIPIKANQPTVFRQLRSLPWAQVSVGHRTRDRGHGRRETRTLKAVTVATPGGLGFPHAAQAIRITRTRTIADKTTRETAYLIVTLPATDAQPVDLHTWARLEWHIENRLHWVRDMTFREDAHQARTGNGPAVAAVLRNTAIGYHRTNGAGARQSRLPWSAAIQVGMPSSARSMEPLAELICTRTGRGSRPRGHRDDLLKRTLPCP